MLVTCLVVPLQNIPARNNDSCFGSVEIDSLYFSQRSCSAISCSLFCIMCNMNSTCRHTTVMQCLISCCSVFLLF